jgi:hypothetical protein
MAIDRGPIEVAVGLVRRDRPQERVRECARLELARLHQHEAGMIVGGGGPELGAG